MDEADKDFELAVALWGALAVGIACTGVFLWVEGHNWGGPLLTLGGLAGVIYVTLHVKGLGLSSRYALVAMVVLTWVLLGYDIYGHGGATRGRLVQGYGNEAACLGILNDSLLTEWQDKYDVALVCGIIDNGQDKYQDGRITVTSLFTIASETLTIARPFSREMTEGITTMRQQARTALHLPPTAPIPLQLWMEPVLLPKNFDLGEIKCLADVTRYGGIIIRQQRPDLF